MQQKLLVVLEEVVVLSREGPELLDAHQQQVVVWVVCICLPQQPLHPHKYITYLLVIHTFEQIIEIRNITYLSVCAL